MENHRYRNILFRANEAFLVQELEMTSRRETIRSDCYAYGYHTLILNKWEQKMKKEIADLRDKIGDFRLHNDYLNCKVFELKDALERKKIALKNKHDKEVMHGFQKLRLENCCNALEKELVELRNNANSNQIHLIEYMRYTVYLKDKVNRMWEDWEALGARRVEYKELQESLPCRSRKRPRKEAFLLEPCGLNLSACLVEALPKADKTKELEEALEFIGRMLHSNTKLREMDRTPTPPPW